MTKVTLTRLGNIVFIRPWIASDPVYEELMELLTCERRVKHPIGYYETHVHELFEEGSNDNGDSICMTYGGLFQRVYKFFKEHRYPVRVIDKQKFLPEPDWSKVPPLRKRQPEAIASITAASRGLIDCPTAFGKSFVIKVLSMMYADLNILVVTKMGRVTNQLYERITEVVEGPVAKVFSSNPKWPENARIVVTTTKSLYKIPVTWPDVVFFDEAHNAAAPDVSGVLSNYASAKLFGFTATPEGRGDGTDLLTEAFFGKPICRIPYQQAVRDGTVAQIKTLFVLIDQPDIDTDDMTTMDKNKEGYWWNELRNRRLLFEAEKRFREDEAVLYYVENTEHALYLRLLQPDLPVAHGGISAKRWKTFLKKGLVEEEDQALLKRPNLDKLEEEFCGGLIKRVVCTGTWKEGVDFPDLAGLVRFDGGAGSIDSRQIGGRLSRIGSDGQKTDALIIDAYDRFGRRYQDRSASRIRAYKKNGWKVRKLW